MNKSVIWKFFLITSQLKTEGERGLGLPTHFLKLSSFFLFSVSFHSSSFLFLDSRLLFSKQNKINKIISCAAPEQQGRDQAVFGLLIQINILPSLICWKSHVHRHGACASTCVALPPAHVETFYSGSSIIPIFLTQVFLPGNGATVYGSNWQTNHSLFWLLERMAASTSWIKLTQQNHLSWQKSFCGLN